MAGYLNTGASDIVFWDAPKVRVYWGWEYVLVLAGPDQASTLRPAPDGDPNWKSTELPELMFPTDRSWLVSFLWDDDWACIGGPEALITVLLADPVLAPNARRVDTQQDATPPGDWPGRPRLGPDRPRHQPDETLRRVGDGCHPRYPQTDSRVRP